ncbi:aspartyl protease family protein [uncultured Bacteroides sp.]|uniref:aspartyl protease family protein n=1 Tax=uncultured Bacteroides sp. TaxID=162156 RepID=UPI0025CD4C9C|nr:aspartyl protease family protein [uncultured Bacteroides sp.]
MNYYRYFSIMFFTLIFLSVYGQENKVEKLRNLLNEGRYFESKELYDEIHQTLDFDEALSYKYRMFSFMDQKDSVAHCLEELLEYYPEYIGNQAINVYVELFNLYFLLGDNEKGMYTYKRLIEHLEDNPYDIAEKDIEECRNYVEKRLVYYKKLMSYPPIKLKRKAIDQPLDIIGEDKFRFDANFNGIKHKTIFDTGVECNCVMNLHYAEKMGIKCDASKIVYETINNEQMPSYEIIMDSIEIGNILLYNVPIQLVDNDITQYLPDSIKTDSIKMAKVDSVKNMMSVPIIGLPVMQMIGKFMIDYENNKLYFPDLHDTSEMTKEPNLFFRNNKVYTQAKINNVPFTGLLDTGSDGAIDIDTVFYEKFKNDIPIDTIAEKSPYNFVMIHCAWVDIPYEIPELTTITLNNKCILPPSENDDPLKIYSMQSIWPVEFLDGVLGYDFFKRIGKKVLLDLDNKRLEAVE